MADRPVFVYAAVYDSITDAEADYVGVMELHAEGTWTIRAISATANSARTG